MGTTVVYACASVPVGYGLSISSCQLCTLVELEEMMKSLYVQFACTTVMIHLSLRGVECISDVRLVDPEYIHIDASEQKYPVNLLHVLMGDEWGPVCDDGNGNN